MAVFERTKRLVSLGLLAADGVFLAAGLAILITLLQRWHLWPRIFLASTTPRGFPVAGLAVLLPSAWCYFLWLNGHYARRLRWLSRLTASDVRMLVAGSMLVCGAVCILGGRLEPSQVLGWFWCLLWGVCYFHGPGVCVHYALRRMLLRRHLQRRILVVGPSCCRERISRFLADHELLLTAERTCWLDGGAADVDGGSGAVSSELTLIAADEMRAAVEGGVVEGVLLADSQAHPAVAALLDSCRETGVDCWGLAGDRASGSFPGMSERVCDVVVSERDPVRLLVKAVIDLIAGASLLVLASPVFLVIAILVRLTSPGPALYRQRRDGYRGRTFTIWKFRTMRHDSQVDPLAASLAAHPDILCKPRHDTRVTRLGYVLRRSSLDELPQLFNVLMGDMSLVGPRPLRPVETASLPAPSARRRLSMKPGMTGLWQVNGRSNVRKMAERIGMDLAYVDRWSLGLDFAILMRTIPAVLSARGAQ